MSVSDSLVYYMNGVASLIFCVLGMGINLYAIHMLIKQRLTAIFHKLMLSLVVYDFLYVTFTLMCYALPTLSSQYEGQILVYLRPYLIPATQIALAGSCFSTVALTMERYMSVCMPFFKQRHNLKAWMFIVPVLVFVVVYCSPRFFEIRTVYKLNTQCYTEEIIAQDESSNWTATLDSLKGINASVDQHAEPEERFPNEEEILRDGANGSHYLERCHKEYIPVNELNELRKNPLYISIYATWMNLLVMLSFPVTLMIVLNVRIYRTMNSFHDPSDGAGKSGQCSQSLLGQSTRAEGMRRVAGNVREMKKRDAKYTRASVVMVVVFVVCTAPRLIPNIMEIFLPYQNFPQWASVLVCVNHLLTVINCDFNFLIYLSFCVRSKKTDTASASSTVTMATAQTGMLSDMSRSTDGAMIHREERGGRGGIVSFKARQSPLSVRNTTAEMTLGIVSTGMQTRPMQTSGQQRHSNTSSQSHYV